VLELFTRFGAFFKIKMKTYPILVIDDDKNLSEMLARFLKEGGYEQVFVCNDPMQAIKLLS
jgi:DNA-binding response OmpR family regulator